MKYLVQWKGFTVEHNSWKRKEDLENVKEIVAEFERRVNIEVRRQEKLDRAEERDFRRGELPGKYIVMIFKNEYLRKLEKNWEKWKEKNKII